MDTEVLRPRQSLVEQYRQLHREGKFAGLTCLRFKEDIRRLVNLTDSQIILDYGSGKGKQYTKHDVDLYWGCPVDCYDIGVPEFSKRPEGAYDGVICCDVLEHLENPDPVIQECFEYAEKFVFFSVHTGPAKKALPDGRNCHLMQLPIEVWRNRIARFNPGLICEVKENA